MNILFIAGKLSGSATGNCVRTVSEEFALRGHYVHIVSAYLESRDTVEYDGHLFVHEIPGKRYVKENRRGGGVIKGLLLRFLSFIQRILIQIKGLFTIVPLFDDVKELYNRASLVIDGEKVNVIIPVINPRESLKVADLLFKKYKVPYIPYYLDSIYGNIGLRILPNGIYKRMALKYEDKWATDAHSIIMMNSIKECYKDVDEKKHKYVSKIVFMDLPLLIGERKEVKIKKKYLFEGKFVIFFAGTMPHRVRDPRYVFQLANMIAKNNIHFYFAGTSDYQKELKSLVEKNRNVHFLGQINHDNISSYANEADILLNIGNSIPGMLPSKVFEYMSYKKPILSTIKNSSDKSVSYLNLYGAAIILDEMNPLSYNAKETSRFIQSVKNGEFNINLTDLTRENGPLYPNTPACFCEGIESLLSHF